MALSEEGRMNPSGLQRSTLCDDWSKCDQWKSQTFIWRNQHVTISKSLIPWYPMYQKNLPVHWNYHHRNQLEIIKGPCLSAFVWTPNHRTSMPSAAGRTLMQKASASLTVGSPADGSQLWIYYICYSAGKVDGSYEYMHPLIRLQLTQSD